MYSYGSDFTQYAFAMGANEQRKGKRQASGGNICGGEIRDVDNQFLVNESTHTKEHFTFLQPFDQPES